MIVTVILAVVCLCLSLLIWSGVKYRNPYKLIFLFGKKGSGKTTLLVRYMIEYHKKGYNVYTNMDGVNLPFVVKISVNDLETYAAAQKSCICLDEVGIDFDSRKFKTFKDGWRDYFKFQRQYKNVVIMTSQTWDVDKKVRDLTDKFFLCGKIGPISYAREIRRGIVLTMPTSEAESRIADSLDYKPGGLRLCWIPKYSKYYQSFNPPERPLFVLPPTIKRARTFWKHQSK